MQRTSAVASPATRLADFVELGKPRITLMVVLTAAVGYCLAAPSPMGSRTILGLIHALIGTGLVAAGASALNQVVEHESDARMARTRGRPLPAGRLEVGAAAAFGLAISALGTAYLYALANPLTAAIGAVTLLLYVAAYTPLKQISPLCTVIGAVPGALPPVMGWTAASGALSTEAWVLFAILFLWQMPHFLAIAWLYRDDYRSAGQPMLTVIDPSGASTARQIVLYGLALVPTSLLPALIGLTGPLYYWGALALGLLYLGAGIQAARLGTPRAARLLLRVSVVYLPALLTLMTVDKAPF